jgi:RimJ/RimL family protein N-acetyltransferase
VTLIDVYSTQDAELILWELLKERTPEMAISHEEMPTWDEHVAYIAKRPVEHWYLIGNDDSWVGSIYLSRRREIGIWLFLKEQRKGYGKAAIEELMRLHPGKFYANVAPTNHNSHSFFDHMNFKMIQVTYTFGG